jgi:hypothetical protein
MRCLLLGSSVISGGPDATSPCQEVSGSCCRSEKLWVPKNNESQRNAKFVSENFPSLARFQFWYLEREDGGSVLTPEAFSKALSIHQKVLKVTWASENAEEAGAKLVADLPETVGITDLCFNISGGQGAADPLQCSMNNPLEVFGYNASKWSSKADILATLNDRTTWDPTLTGPGFVLEGVLGGVEKSTDGNILDAKVLGIFYLLANDPTLLAQQKPNDAALGWEQGYLDVLKVRCCCHSSDCQCVKLS